MIHALEGTLVSAGDQFAVVRLGSISCRVFISKATRQALPAPGGEVRLATHLYWRESGPELYGFASEAERNLFVSLVAVSGVGPKSAIGILGIGPLNQIVAAVNEGRPDLLTRASGIGRKTAERVVLELKGKLAPAAVGAGGAARMETDLELEDALVGLGYSRRDAKDAIAKIDPKVKGFKERLKAALKKSA